MLILALMLMSGKMSSVNILSLFNKLIVEERESQDF